MNPLTPVMTKNDKQAKWLIGIFSLVIFLAVVIMGRVKLPVQPAFDVHIFARINAGINSVVTLMLIAALIAIKRKNYVLHKRLMIGAMILSVLFLISYVCHHLLSADTRFGSTGAIRYLYFFILGTHILLAATILPFILYTAYRAFIAEWPLHRKLARITWPIWLYVSVTGVLVYLFISPYYR